MSVSRTVSEILSVKNGVTLKPGVGVVQGHWKWRRSVIYDFLLVGHCKYSYMLYHFQIIGRSIIVTWKSGLQSLKTIQTGTIRKLGCGFLFAFHSNYGYILHHFRDKARYWSKIVIFFIPLAFDAPVRGGARRSISIPFGIEKLG